MLLQLITSTIERVSNVSWSRPNVVNDSSDYYYILLVCYLFYGTLRFPRVHVL